MYGLTRGTMTLLGIAAAGFLLWVATQVNDNSTGGYWIALGLLAAAGLCMALSQLLGGWTKWGWPRVTGTVFLLGFLPTLVAAGWIVLAGQPRANWFHDHVLSWSNDLSIRGLVDDVHEYISVLAFGTGLVFGFTFDTTGPRVRRFEKEPPFPAVRPPAGREPVAAGREPEVADAPSALAAEREAEAERAPSERTVEVREGGTTTTAPPPPTEPD